MSQAGARAGWQQGCANTANEKKKRREAGDVSRQSGWDEL
jgi:hypothetical protein